MKSVNPATGQTIREYVEHDDREVERRLAAAAESFERWRDVPVDERASMLRNVGKQLAERAPQDAQLMTLEMGKPISQSIAEIDKCRWVCEYYAEHAPGFLEPEAVDTGALFSGCRFDPLGPILIIMPWNFPYWQVFRCAVPALASGNTVLLKHAANVPGCALALEEIFRQAGLPEGVFSTLLISSSRVEELIGRPEIRAVSLTGSERAGRSVAEAAGRNLKKCVLELGGSDPFIVLDDAQMPDVVEQAVRARCINSGQSCIAAKRFIVQRPLVERFQDEMAARMQRLRVGDPSDPQTEVGPLAREDLLEGLHQQVVASVRQGARLLTGGEPLQQLGYFYTPTVLTDVSPGMAAFDEETFGPVAAVIAADDVEHAIALANQSRYGLGASIWSADSQRALQLARRIDAGAVFINEIVKSDPRLPFGGVKESGYGRELARHGLLEMVNIKTVWAQ